MLSEILNEHVLSLIRLEDPSATGFYVQHGALVQGGRQVSVMSTRDLFDRIEAARTRILATPTVPLVRPSMVIKNMQWEQADEKADLAICVGCNVITSATCGCGSHPMPFCADCCKHSDQWEVAYARRKHERRTSQVENAEVSDGT